MKIKNQRNGDKKVVEDTENAERNNNLYRENKLIRTKYNTQISSYDIEETLGLELGTTSFLTLSKVLDRVELDEDEETNDMILLQLKNYREEHLKYIMGLYQQIGRYK